MNRTASGVYKAVGNTSLKRRGACVYDLCVALPDHGVGRTVRRKIWAPDCYYTLTRVEAHQVPRVNLNRGTAYGVLTWRGEVIDSTERRLRGAAKRDWMVSRSVMSIGGSPLTSAS